MIFPELNTQSCFGKVIIEESMSKYTLVGFSNLTNFILDKTALPGVSCADNTITEFEVSKFAEVNLYNSLEQALGTNVHINNNKNVSVINNFFIVKSLFKYII